jgi:flagellar motor switch protein FliN/FliY
MDSEKIGQNEIEELLRQAQNAASAPPAAAEPGTALGPSGLNAVMAGAAGSPPANATQAVTPDAQAAPTAAPARRLDEDMQFLLAQAEQALASVDRPTAVDLTGLTPFQLRDFGGAPASSEKATLELLRDVELDLKIELGRTQMVLEEVLKLRKGSVVPLDKLAGDPVDIYVNGRLIARGEVLVLNDNFCVRVAELLATEEAA